MSDVRTLADYRARPHTSNVNYEGVSAEVIANRYPDYLKDQSLVKPETLAITFYLLNSACAAIMQTKDKNQPLTAAEMHVLDEYYQAIETIGHRVFFYMMMICTRETRHVSINDKMKEKVSHLGAMDFWKTLKGTGSDGAVERFLSKPPTCSLRNYTEHMYWTFQLGGHGSGYAGPAWAKVAKPLNEFVQGNITMEMLLDTAWTLAHNNGPIFNKGMLFEHQNNSELIKILDVQRSGQIPNLVRFKESKFVGPIHKQLLALIDAAIQDFGNSAVDWQKVVDLGAVGHYGVKKSPVKLTNNPMKIPTSILDVAKPAKIKPELVFQITPTEVVKKITRKETK